MPVEEAAGTMILRAARPADMARVFAWRNDPWIVSLSGSQRPVEWEEHVAWFERVAASPDHLLLVAESEDGTGMGIVRVDRREPRQADITIYLLRPFVGRGLGVIALRRAGTAAFRRWPELRAIHAAIRPENAASRNAFAKAGFAERPGANAGLVEMVLEAGADGVVKAAWAEDDARVMRFYRDRLGTYGSDPRSLDWASRASQELRFRVLLGIGVKDGDSLLDLGCGLGDLVGHLVEGGRHVDYTGYDLTPAMVAAARERHPGARFEMRDILTAPPPPESFDWVLGSGIFDLRQTEPLRYVQAAVRAMFAACRRGVAFNTLSACARAQTPAEFYAEPTAVLGWCLAVTPEVILRHDYLPHDFTVYLYRGAAAR